MSIRNKSVYETYQRILQGFNLQAVQCPVCENAWSDCSHYAKELAAYAISCNKHIEHLELRVAEAETTAMVLGRQNYELRQAVVDYQKRAKYYNEVAVELSATLHAKRYELTNKK